MSDFTPPSAHGRPPAPLSDTETRAALRAVGHILELARDEVGRFAKADKLTDVLASAGALPEMLTRPAVFRERFDPGYSLQADWFAHPVFPLTRVRRKFMNFLCPIASAPVSVYTRSG